jgi:hypothetical protein
MGIRTLLASKRVRLLVLVSGLVAVAGCSLVDPRSSAPLTPVMIESLQDVHGQWEGTVRELQSLDRGWVTVNITDRDSFATYTFAGTAKGNPFLGTGRVQLQNGRLLTEGEGRTLTFALAERDGVRMLVVDGIGKDGKSHHAELSRAE